jgi:uncharacterized Fe-S cluster protein YjdI
VIKHYTNNEVTIEWKPEQCIHSTICWRELKEVFNPRERPWVKIEGATTERIIEQVRKCPSGALSYFMNAEAVPENGLTTKETTSTDTVATEAAPAHVAAKEETPKRDPQAEAASILTVEVTPRGPYILNTQCVIIHADGHKEIKEGVVALCRCGASNNKPYCDGRHAEVNFEG